MKITFLGTGTSHGVPMIGCDCDVCLSDNPKNNRTRSSVYIEYNGVNLLIDTTPELRIQAIREKISKVDAIIYTHAHADHLFGLDDVRRFNQISKAPLPCYGMPETLETIKTVFSYAFKETQMGGGKPQLILNEIDGPFEINGVLIQPIKALHGRMNVLGYRINNFAYLTDCSRIPSSSEELLYNLDLLVLGVLRHKPHTTHFSLEQGVEIVNKFKPKQALFTHIAHKLEHESTNKSLPENINLAYDGLKIVI